MTDLSKDLNLIAADMHAANAHWWRNPATGERIERNKGELLMLVISELSEAMEGERKDLWDDHLPHRKMAEVELADAKIRIFDFAGGFRYLLVPATALGYELSDNRADALFQICAEVVRARAFIELGVEFETAVGAQLGLVLLAIDLYAEKFGHKDVPGAIAEKRAYNATRADHKAEARLAANGKKF